MKFLLVSPFSSISGSSIRFWNIASNLQKKGHQVVYVERKPDTSPGPVFSNITYYSSKTLPNLFIDIFISTLFNIYILIKHRNCDIFYACKPAPNNCLPALIAKMMGKVIFLDIDDIDYGYFEPGLKRYISQLFFNFFPRFFHLVTCHTETLKSHIQKEIGIPPEKIFFLKQGLSDVFLSYDINSMPRNANPTLVYSATLHRTTDFGDIIPMIQNLCNKYKELRVKIIGDGEKKPLFLEEMKKCTISDQVIFTGRVDHRNIPGVIADGWIGINYMRPSFTNNCRAIFKIREYCALGLQVVCNNTGDAAVFKKYIYIEQSIKAMEKRIITLLDQKVELNAAGSRFVKDNYQWGTCIDDFLNRVVSIIPQ